MKPYFSKAGITLYHADCREVLPLLGTFDLLLTDPPYGLGDKLHYPGPGRQWSKLYGNGAPEWDKKTSPGLLTALGMAKHAIVWGGHYYNLPPAGGWLIWDKIIRNFSSGHCELAWTNLDQPIRAFNYSHGQLASEGKLHPTQKPLPLMAWCLGQVSEARTVLDPFAGSGTTLRAAMDAGLEAVGIEREEHYCEAAARRLEQSVLPFAAPEPVAEQPSFFVGAE